MQLVIAFTETIPGSKALLYRLLHSASLSAGKGLHFIGFGVFLLTDMPKIRKF
jgi:hypothetical protein